MPMRMDADPGSNHHDDADDDGPCDVLFVYLPYGAIERPSIALGLLKQVLVDHGFSAGVHYANITFAEQIGLPVYDAISRLSREMAGEWTFAGAAFPDAETDHDGYMRALGEILKPSVAEAAAREIAAQLWPVRRLAEAFIARTVREIVARRPKIVGVSSMFQQHCAALALLRHLKHADPDIVTLIGGANCEDQMGLATWRNFPFVDYVVSGEADELLPDLVANALRYRARTPPARLPAGVLGRGGPAGVAPPAGIGRARVERLDGSPIPDYRDYFRRLSHSPLRDLIRPGLPIETARGCWWGAVRHCTFCGLNGSSMAFRAKSPERAIGEFATLADRHGINRFMVVDNIIDLDYFKTVLPRLREDHAGDWQIFYETKANLRRDQVALMRDAGIAWIQPGIESLNDNLLKQMAKGTTALINTRLLKWAREDGLFVSWNILFDIPQENDDDYRDMAGLIPALVHLQPPQAMVRVRVERFSPYQKTPELYELNIAPAWPYRYIYPLAEQQLAQLCYNFDTLGKARLQTTGDSIPGASPPIEPGSGLALCHQAVTAWRQLHDAAAKPLLCITPRADGGATVLDTRPCARQRVSQVSAAAAGILALCDGGATSAQIDRRRLAPGEWDALIGNRWLLALGEKYLSLPVNGDVPALPARQRFPGGYITAGPETSGLLLAE
ncbi:hypothetical protein WJ33_04220 [Burkholderia ubonensis]|uniref:Uncharacterized protein n=1 Tax=Burkholderia ubonensis TaxID=101571 RepID=A0A118HM58_9BURK|nr:RiPP maturation radical SAM C-methyltransferase [Burkholderia ubonensis]KVG57271.1 hypothetical protein WJ33_04220 [Burkholderia ubonensis]